MELAQGRYQLIRQLGAGGAAEVHLAHDTTLGVDRAIKLLDTRNRTSSTMERRFLAEARAMARLRHPNILRVYDIAQDGDRSFVVMEVAQGGSLADWLETNGPMPIDTALQYAVQLLAALAAAHAEGIVHRDVKPQNILLDENGRALLADFGIALLSEDDDRRTRTGVMMGSVPYMAPEQRIDARSVGPTADIYATAASMYNLITGGNPVDLFAARQDSPRWAGIPEEVTAILRQGTRYEPGERFPDARSMAQAIVNLLPRADNLIYAPTNPEQFPAPSQSLVSSVRDTEPPSPAQDDVAFAMQSLTVQPDLFATPSDVNRTPTIESAPPGASLVAAADIQTWNSGSPAVPPSADPPMKPPATPPDTVGSSTERQGTNRAALVLLLLLLAIATVGARSLWTQSPTPTAPQATADPLPTADPLLLDGPVPNSTPEDPPTNDPSTEAQVSFQDPSAGSSSAPSSVNAANATGPTSAPDPASTPSQGSSEDTLLSDESTPSRAEIAPVTGTWEGSFGGFSADLTLSGSPGKIRGSILVFQGTNQVKNAVRGIYQSETRTLTLQDSPDDLPDAGTYQVDVNSSLTRFEGIFTDKRGTKIPISFHRISPAD